MSGASCENDELLEMRARKIHALKSQLEEAEKVINSIAHNGYEDNNGRHEIIPEQVAQEYFKKQKIN